MSGQDPAIVVLRRGDKVLVAMREEPEPEDGLSYIEALHDNFPGVEFVLLGGVAGLALMPGEKKPEDT